MASNCCLVMVVVQESEFSAASFFPGGHTPWMVITTASGGTSAVETEGCGGVAAGDAGLGGPGYCECANTDARTRTQVVKTDRIIARNLPAMRIKEKCGGGMRSWYHSCSAAE